MKEFIEEYGGIIVIVLIGLLAINGMYEVLRLVCGIAA